MPIYAFQCAACGHAFDRLQKLADPDPTVCPACAAEAVKRQITAPAFRLSGSGWYETDFSGRDKKKNVTDAGGGDAAKPAADSAPAKPEPKVEAKPAAKPAA
jgi:putative FmdB family regulatory protein